MGFRINTNMASLQSQSSLNKVNRDTTESSAKLSSGLRITKAADDAAGLAISEKLKAEIRSSKQANRNANDGLSLVQVAEGGLTETSGILTRMRELSMQAASDTLEDSDRAKSSMEYEQLKNELERISQSTEFNGKKLLNGSGPKLDFQVGVGDHSMDDQISYNTSGLNSGLQSLGVSSASITSKLSAQESLSNIDTAINKVSANKATLGSIQNRLITSSNNLTTYHENMSAANNRIRDVDYADESAKQARNSILGDANTAVLAQANMSGQAALKLV
ncbi:MAG: flagellin FliC [Bdellovibrionales bacterium]|nr:flagellin FliC [Bdellovibrionales bacterium]